MVKNRKDNSLLAIEDIKQLLKRKTEDKNLDYKKSFNWSNGSKDQKLEIVKDILAMANTQDGGKIVFGVRDDDFEFVGLTEDDLKSFDQTTLNEFLHKYTDPKFSCQVYKQKVEEDFVVVIDTPEFQEEPIVCKENAHSSADNSKLILKKGALYVRTEKGSSETIPSSKEMRELLGRAIIKKGDELLHNIERLIKGKPLKISDESKEGYSAEIKKADKFLLESIGNELKKFGYWEVYAYPSYYKLNRVADQKVMKELIRKSEVRLRGWNFPHTDSHGNASNFTRGRQSYTVWERYREGYRAYKSGLFVWKRAFWEDIGEHGGEGKPILSFISAIWSITEFFLFFKRYYEEIALGEDLHIKIVLNGTKDRSLVALGSNVFPLSDYCVAKENPIFFEEDLKVVELKASYKEIANRMIKEIFLVFNSEEITEKTIDQWQTKLIERNM